MTPVHIDDYEFGVGWERACGCRSCGSVFASEGAFNRHRIGKHGVDRRCATDLPAKGLELDHKGRWRRAKR